MVNIKQQVIQVVALVSLLFLFGCYRMTSYYKALKNPQDAKAQLYAGCAYLYDQKRYNEAIFYFNRAIEINPRYAEAYGNRAFAYSAKGEYDRAISDFSKAIEINPRYAVAYNNRAGAYYYKGEYDKAWEDVYKAQGLGYQVSPRLLELLRQASGRQR